jgi:hypothetical protein
VRGIKKLVEFGGKVLLFRNPRTAVGQGLKRVDGVERPIPPVDCSLIVITLFPYETNVVLGVRERDVRDVDVIEQAYGREI